MQQTIIADYADDKVILSINEDPLITSINLQVHLINCPSGMKNGESKLIQTNLYTQHSHYNKEYVQTLLSTMYQFPHSTQLNT